MSFFFSFFFSLSSNWERERVYNWVLGETVSKFTYLISMDSCGEYFLFHRLAKFLNIYLWLEGMGTSCPGLYFAPLPGVLALDSPHLFTTTSVPKLIFLFPTSADGRTSHFHLRVLANHLAFFFFLPLSGDSLGLLYVPVLPSLPIWSPSTNIC